MARRRRSPAMPAVIQVGPYRFKIAVEKFLTRSSVLGETHGSDLIIGINPSQHPMMMRETMIHELLHACFHTSSLTHAFNDDDEERIVAILSPWVLMLLRENPELLDWLSADEDDAWIPLA